MSVPRERARTFLAYGFAVSIAVHALALPFVHAESTSVQETPTPDLVLMHVPTPPPTPRPTPTPERTVPPTPPPRERPQTPAPQPRPIEIVPPRATAHAGGPTEDANAHASGDVLGAPDAHGTGAPEAAALAGTPAPASAATPVPRPTPTPLCARPDVPASTVRALEPDTPALAQQQGISGVVNVIVSLDARSRVVAARIQSSPSAVLNAAALAAARGSQFATEVKSCEPVAADYVFSVEFTSQ